MNSTKFVIGIFLAIFIAKLAPSIGKTGGPLLPEITVKYLAVAVIFLNSGLTLPSEELQAALFRWDIHLFIQGFTFLVFPLYMFIVVSILKHTFLDTAILEGLTILSTMPPPVSSAIIMTRAVGGNEAAAVFNSALGSMLGIFITPALILIMLDTSEIHIPSQKIFTSLFIKCVIPLIVGQGIRTFYHDRLVRLGIPYRTIGNVMILLIVYSTFCNMFSRSDTNIHLSAILATAFLILILHLSILAVLPWLSSLSIFPFTSLDSVTITYCCAQKSLTLGIPVIELIFEGDPLLVYRIIPLLLYGPMQIILGVLSVNTMQNWLYNTIRIRRKFTKHV